MQKDVLWSIRLAKLADGSSCRITCGAALRMRVVGTLLPLLSANAQPRSIGFERERATVSRCARRQESGGRPRRTRPASATVWRPISSSESVIAPARWGESIRPSTLRAGSSGGAGSTGKDVGRGAEASALDLAQELGKVDHAGPAHQEHDRTRRDHFEFALAQESVVLAGDGGENDDDPARRAEPRRARRVRRRIRP